MASLLAPAYVDAVPFVEDLDKQLKLRMDGIANYWRGTSITVNFDHRQRLGLAARYFDVDMIQAADYVHRLAVIGLVAQRDGLRVDPTKALLSIQPIFCRLDDDWKFWLGFGFSKMRLRVVDVTTMPHDLPDKLHESLMPPNGIPLARNLLGDLDFDRLDQYVPGVAALPVLDMHYDCGFTVRPRFKPAIPSFDTIQRQTRIRAGRAASGVYNIGGLLKDMVRQPSPDND